MKQCYKKTLELLLNLVYQYLQYHSVYITNYDLIFMICYFETDEKNAGYATETISISKQNGHFKLIIDPFIFKIMSDIEEIRLSDQSWN